MIGAIREMAGEMCYFLDDVQVTKEMYDAYFPSKLFPTPIRYTKEEIEEMVRLGEAAEITPEMKKRLPKGYPIRSMSMAVHTTQIKEAMEHDRKLGVPTNYSRNGEPIWTDAAHRKRFMKAHKLIDRNSYNGY